MSYFLFKPPFRLVQGNKIPRTSIVIVEKQVQSSQVLSEKGNNGCKLRREIEIPTQVVDST